MWELRFLPTAELPKGYCGECDAPDVPGKEIRISDELKGELLLDTIIHEAMHGALFHLGPCEAFIERAASDIARIVWKPEVLRKVLDDPKAKSIILEAIRESVAE